MEDIEMNDLLVTEATKPNRRDLVKQLTEWRFWKLTLGCVLCVLLTLCAVGLFCWAINNRTQTHPDVDNGSNRPKRQSMCERHEESCTYNNPSDTKQPEEPKQPEVTETETVPMEASLLMEWMQETGWAARMFQWQNKSAALPVVKSNNWIMATHSLAATSPSTNSTWSLQEKRVYVHWAEWAVQLSEETNWTMESNWMMEHVEKVKTELHLLQLQNLDAAPEGGDVSLMTGKPTTTAEKFKEEEAVDKEEEDVEAPPKPRWGQYGDSKEQSDHREIHIHKPITYQ